MQRRKRPAKERVKNAAFYAACAAALGAALAVLALLAYTLSIRTEWKKSRLTLCENFTQAVKYNDATLGRGEEQIPADEKMLDYYLDFLMMSSGVICRRNSPENDRTITLRLPGVRLTLTPAVNGEDTIVQWEKNGTRYGYLLNGSMKFLHLETYFENQLRNAQSE